MKKAFFKSIRFQVIVLYLLILAATLTILRVALYSNFRNILQSELDAKLRLKAEGLEESIRTYWQTQQLEMTKEWTNKYLFYEPRDDKFKTISSQLTLEKLEKRDEVPTIILIFDAKGRLINSSQDIPDLAGVREETVSVPPGRKTRFHNLDLKLSDGRLVPVRVISKPVINQKEVKYVVQVLASLLPLREELYQLKKSYFLQMPIILLVAIAGALFLVQITLTPVDEMVRTIGQINQNNLKLRIKVPKTGDEIARLAETFNEMLEGLEKSFSAQRQIVQDISHELKTPLTILKGQQEVALKRDRSVAEYKDILSSNLEEVEKMKRIISNLLLLARFDKDSFFIETKNINLNELLRSVFEEMKVFAKKAEVQLEFLERSEEVLVEGNETYLKLLFKNLVDNAIKYTTAGGKVTIQLNKFKPFAHIDIIDTGIGIPESELSLIFNRFYRVDKARSGGEGFGLGLSIAKSLLEAHRGQIRVQSQINKGTMFSIDLPLLS